MQPASPHSYAPNVTVTAQQAANLTPFTGEEGRARASAAGKKSAAVRKANKEAHAVAKVKTSVELNEKLAEIALTFQRGTLAAAAASTAQYLMALIVSGAVEMQGRDLAPLISSLVDVARLEEGQSTSNAVVAHLSSAETRARLTELRGTGGAEAITPLEVDSTAQEG